MSQRISHKITILDGGMGRELERMGAPFRQPEWSALALMEAPEAVKKAHQSFIQAGAQIITTNTYAIIPHHIGEERFQTDGAALIRKAAQLAQNAATAGHNIRIAGCIPPLFGSYLPDHFPLNVRQS
jgi:S-methylmethionine-dependent homocysteine/selenocysteine methylase